MKIWDENEGGTMTIARPTDRRAGLAGWIASAGAAMFRRRHRASMVTEGSLFECAHGKSMVELAEVEWIGKDHCGIPHVHFRLSCIWPSRREPEGTRVLALDCFVERYRPVSEGADIGAASA